MHADGRGDRPRPRGPRRPDARRRAACCARPTCCKDELGLDVRVTVARPVVPPRRGRRRPARLELRACADRARTSWYAQAMRRALLVLVRSPRAAAATSRRRSARSPRASRTTTTRSTSTRAPRTRRVTLAVDDRRRLHHAAVPRRADPRPSRSTATPPSVTRRRRRRSQRAATGYDDRRRPLTLERRPHDSARRRSATSQVGYSITKDSEQQPVLLPRELGRRLRSVRAVRQPPRSVRDVHVPRHAPGDAARRAARASITERQPTETDVRLRPRRRPDVLDVRRRRVSRRGPQTDKGMWGGVHVTLYDRAVDEHRPPRSIPRITPASRRGCSRSSARTRSATSCACSPRRRTGAASSIPATSSSTTRSRGGSPSLLERGRARARSRDRAQWAGDQTTLAGTYDFVWKESMAEYLSYVYEDMTSTRPTACARPRRWKAVGDGAAVLPGARREARRCSTTTATSTARARWCCSASSRCMTSREQVLAAIKTLLGKPHAIVGRRRDRRARDVDRARPRRVRRRVDPRHRRAGRGRARHDVHAGAPTSTLASPARRQRRGAASSTSRSRARMPADVQLVEVDTFHERSIRRSRSRRRVHGDVASMLDPLPSVSSSRHVELAAHAPADRPHPWAAAPLDRHFSWRRCAYRGALFDIDVGQ